MKRIYLNDEPRFSKVNDIYRSSECLIKFDSTFSRIHCQQHLLYYSSSNQDFTIKNGTLPFIKVNFSPYFLQRFLPTETKLKDFRQKIKLHSSKICGYEELLQAVCNLRRRVLSAIRIYDEKKIISLNLEIA